MRACLKPLASLLKTGDPHATVDRLFSSQHVEDLRLIITVACIAVLLVLVIGIPLALENVIVHQWSTIAARSSNWVLVRLAFEAMGNFLKFFAPVLAVFGATLAWAYQAGSARLGVVDLFACEISTICRVVAVADSVRRCVDGFEQNQRTGSVPPHGPARRVNSPENYFPVFASNTRDLETLEARVVINITAFYNYTKAVRDTQQTLEDTTWQSTGLAGAVSAGSEDAAWRDATRSMIYMLFLSLESARHAIADLVEFEPDNAERTIVILISELEAFRFLRKEFADQREMHYGRLELRMPGYKKLVPKLCASVRAGKASREPHVVDLWEPAWLLVRELEKRYHAAMAAVETVSSARSQHASA